MKLVLLIVILCVSSNYRISTPGVMCYEEDSRINTIQNVYRPQIRHKRRVTTADKVTESAPIFAPLTLINWNIEGIKYQLTNPEKIFKDADLVMLTETLNVDRPASICGYTCVASPAKQAAKYGRPTGGLTVYGKSHLNIRPIHISDTRIHLDSVFGQVLVYYAHASKSAGDIIGDICRDLRLRHEEVAIIGGDFNCRIETNSAKAETLLAFMSTIGFQLVNDASVATFLSKHNGGASVIDLVFLNTDKVQGKATVDVLRTASKKHQRVFVRAKLKVAHPELYNLHRKIGEINDRTSEKGEVTFRPKTKGGKSKEKTKLGIFGRIRDKWKNWFG